MEHAFKTGFSGGGPSSKALTCRMAYSVLALLYRHQNVDTPQLLAWILVWPRRTHEAGWWSCRWTSR